MALVLRGARPRLRTREARAAERSSRPLEQAAADAGR